MDRFGVTLLGVPQSLKRSAPLRQMLFGRRRWRLEIAQAQTAHDRKQFGSRRHLELQLAHQQLHRFIRIAGVNAVDLEVT